MARLKTYGHTNLGAVAPSEHAAKPLLYIQDLVLRVFVHELLPRGGKLAQLVAHHVLRYLKLNILLSVVNLELQPNKLGKNGTASSVGSDGCFRFHGLGYGKGDHMWTFPG